MHPRAVELIERLALQPHPEGGHYREVFRSPREVRPDAARGPRAALTTIYFLLARGERSRWHRISSDEVWHFYEGDPLELLATDEGLTGIERASLGPVSGSTLPVYSVPAGTWQAARPLGAFSLVGCSVGPGFDFADFALLADHPREAERLRERFPEVASLI
jgi:uncharacterized protein